MLTDFGKLLRKLRIDHDLKLGDLAEKMEVSAAYISAVETGKKPVTTVFLRQVGLVMRLSEHEMRQLERAASQQVKDVTMPLNAKSDRAKELAVAFARRFESMSKEDIEKMFDRLDHM